MKQISKSPAKQNPKTEETPQDLQLPSVPQKQVVQSKIHLPSFKTSLNTSLTSPQKPQQADANINTSEQLAKYFSDNSIRQARKLILDGYMIMQKYKFESPSEITAVNIQKNHLNDVYEEDMIHFTNVCQINLTDNEIPLFKL